MYQTKHRNYLVPEAEVITLELAEVVASSSSFGEVGQAGGVITESEIFIL